MFRKLVIAAVASLALLSPLAMPTETQAREVRHVHRGHAVHRVYRTHNAYRVYYRNGNAAWNCGVTYGSRAAARHAAANYRARGFQCYIR